MILYIANRGEIARRIIRTSKRMGFKTAVGFADQDRELPFVEEADIQIPLKGEEAKETYIQFQKVLGAAREAKATHLHPGYGFLSENPAFVEEVEKAGIEFVGPSAKSMRLLGDKIGSRNFLKKHGIPMLPSYDGESQSPEILLQKANELGFPLLIKPSAGGGGKGMLACFSEKEFLPALDSAKRIATSAFGDDRVFLEKFVKPARHIEVQILADKSKNIYAIGERECSLQRKHQKVIEETPCLFLSPRLREKIFEDSKRLALEANYHSLGTVEWIWDGADGIYFLEVNARLQVEHPVTEMVWGLDLVELQLKVALGESLSDLKLHPSGHSIEARICAEDPSQDFLPSGGKIHRLQLPENVRIDFGYREKNSIPPQFDSMLGKVIAHSDNRMEALRDLQNALEKLVIMGPTTNRAYLVKVLGENRVQEGELSTDLLKEISFQFDISKAFELLRPQNEFSGEFSGEDDQDLDYFSPWGSIPRVSESGIDWADFGEKRYFHTKFSDWNSPRPRSTSSASKSSSTADTRFSNVLISPMPAKVNKILVSIGQRIKKGDLLLILEAMKMEHQMKAPIDAVVKEVFVKEGDRVSSEAELIKWEELKAQ